MSEARTFAIRAVSPKISVFCSLRTFKNENMLQNLCKDMLFQITLINHFINIYKMFQAVFLCDLTAKTGRMEWKLIKLSEY